MIKRSTWILLVVFVVLMGLAYAWTGYQNNQKKSQATLTPTPQQNLFMIDSASVASFSILDNTTGSIVSVGRDPKGQWNLTEPKAEYTDISSVEAVVTQLGSLQIVSVLESPANLGEFGLAQPSFTITVNINGGQQYSVKVGSLTATSNGYYVLTPDNVPKIIAKYGLDSVLKLLQNPPVATPTAGPTTPLLTNTPPP